MALSDPLSGSKVDLSIIIPVFNKKTLTQNMLASLVETLAQSITVEIIIVDDASTDETSVWLASLSSTDLACPQIKTIRVLRNAHNLGYAKSNNLAAKQAHGALLALLNNDLVLQPGWLEPMLAMFERYPSKPMIVGNLQCQPDIDTLDHAGVEVRLDTESNRPVIEHRRESIPAEPEKVFAVTGACCLIKRQTFETLGGFDEVYINGGEDVDLCMKVTQAGGACWIVPSSRVLHHVSQTRGRQEDRDEKNSWRLFQLWHKQIAQALELSCAGFFTDAPHEDPLTKRMAAEFLEGTRSIAPIAVKAMAQQYVQTELTRWNNKFMSVNDESCAKNHHKC
jgi:GT2 family glycosyltransferase